MWLSYISDSSWARKKKPTSFYSRWGYVGNAARPTRSYGCSCSFGMDGWLALAVARENKTRNAVPYQLVTPNG